MDPQLRGVAELLKGSSLLRSQVGPLQTHFLDSPLLGGGHILLLVLLYDWPGLLDAQPDKFIGLRLRACTLTGVRLLHFHYHSALNSLPSFCCRFYQFLSDSEGCNGRVHKLIGSFCTFRSRSFVYILSSQVPGGQI